MASPQVKESEGQKRHHTSWKLSFPYDASYNDHFETPLIAYEDILPLIEKLGPLRKNHTIYDPYYCNGKTVDCFKKLGFEMIINRKRDFYKDVQNKCTPTFDTLVTNPPYSDQHKSKCLDFAFKQLRQNDKPFFLLMPDYVAAKEYFRTRDMGDVLYLRPEQPYEYTHPEGTGKDVPPFNSLWFCGIGSRRVKQVVDFWGKVPWHYTRTKPSLATSLEELRQMGVIATAKRPNPRQRKKRRQNQIEQLAKLPPDGNEVIGKRQKTKKSYEDQSIESSKIHGKKKSKYRNVQGKRVKKRF